MDISVSQQSTRIPGELLFEEVFVSEAREKLRVIDELMGFMGTRRSLNEQDQFRVRLCLDEVLENALKHGNKYDRSKKVSISYFEADAGWGVLVRDEGEGFDPADVLDPETEEALFRENGRGLFILKKFMDTLEYFDEGRTAFLFKSNSLKPPEI